MDKSRLPQLTPSELDIMKVLWSEGPLSAREVHDRVGDRNGWAYSTTRTTIERLVRKGALEKWRFHGLHLYEASISRPAGLARLVKEFASQVLELSEVPVVSLFADSDALSEDEIEELREMLEASSTEEA